MLDCGVCYSLLARVFPRLLVPLSYVEFPLAASFSYKPESVFSCFQSCRNETLGTKQRSGTGRDALHFHATLPESQIVNVCFYFASFQDAEEIQWQHFGSELHCICDFREYKITSLLSLLEDWRGKLSE